LVRVDAFAVDRAGAPVFLAAGLAAGAALLLEAEAVAVFLAGAAFDAVCARTVSGDTAATAAARQIAPSMPAARLALRSNATVSRISLLQKHLVEKSTRTRRSRQREKTPPSWSIGASAKRL
jgi:phosphoglycerate-specific signal transduction histidine kinase